MNKWEVDEHKQWSEKVRSCSLLIEEPIKLHNYSYTVFVYIKIIMIDLEV